MTDQIYGDINWRSLKAMHEHYLTQPVYEEGKSADDLIRSYREQQRLHRSMFQLGNARPWVRPQSDLVVLGREKDIDEKIKEIRGDVHRRMLADAAEGTWLAMGRRGPDARHELIPPRYWPFLRLDIDQGAVTGDGLSFRDLRCAITNDIPKEDPIHGALTTTESAAFAAGVSSFPLAKAVDPKNGGPGRPSGMYLVEQEFTRRRDAGILKPSLALESTDLAQWFKTTHAGIKPLTPKSIANKLRFEFRAAKAHSTPNCPKL